MEFVRPTDQKHIIQCESGINRVTWGSACASVGENIKIDIGTSFMGLGSEVNLIFKDQRGRTVLELTKRVYADRVTTTIDIPEKIKTHLICEATLSTNGKSLQSKPLVIVSPRSMHELKWSHTSVRRGDVVTLRAQTLGFVPGTRVIIQIYEYDTFGAHLPVGELLTSIDNDAIEVKWQFQHKGDTKNILTELEWSEQNKHYQAPSYFWVADVDGLRYGLNQNSGLLNFDKDDIKIKLHGYAGLQGSDYVVTLADGKEVTGRLSADGLVNLSDIAPGPVRLKMENLASVVPQSVPDIMPKGSIPLPGKIPNYQAQAANSLKFGSGWGWKRFSLLKNATWVGVVTKLLTSGSMRLERWQASGYEYAFYVDDNIITISTEQRVIAQLLIQDNEFINIIGETADHKPILGAMVGVIDADGNVATIVAAMDDDSDLKWRIYKANGGEESFEVWFNSGEPLDVEVEYPVRIPETAQGGVDIKFDYIDNVSSLDVYNQTKPFNCAPGCGRQFLLDEGIDVPESVLEKLMMTSNNFRIDALNGTSIDNLVDGLNQALKNIGSTYSVKGGGLADEFFQPLVNLGKPWIAGLKNGGTEHFVIVDGMENDLVKVRDPWGLDGSNNGVGGSKATLTVKNFKQYWRNMSYEGVLWEKMDK